MVINYKLQLLLHFMYRNWKLSVFLKPESQDKVGQNIVQK